MLCRRDIQLPLQIKSKLKCRYVHKNNPYLRIAPLKEEEAYLEPRILLYRDVIYHNEIEIVKQLAHPRVRIHFILILSFFLRFFSIFVTNVFFSFFEILNYS